MLKNIEKVLLSYNGPTVTIMPRLELQFCQEHWKAYMGILYMHIDT